ncbi:MAG: LamG-like jellyroll fold domain-containing protein [Candidatus Thorarchaeota archaeon]
MRKPAAAVMLFIIFLLPSVGGPEFNGVVPYLDKSINRDTDFENAGWQDASSGIGAPRTVDFQGLATSSGTTVIDATHPGYIGIEPPLGWSSEQLEADLDHLSTWVDADLVNPRLDDVHPEKFIVAENNPINNADNVNVPDGWTIIKTERDSDGGGRETHPEHGIFELNSQSGGYDGSTGFRFEAQWGGSDVLYSGDAVYISQQVDIPYREVYSAEVRFLYYTMGTGRVSIMENQTYVFARLADYTFKFHNFEPSDAVDTWLEGVATIPSEAFENLPPGEASVLDIGLGTDLSGAQGVAQASFVIIDEIELRLQVRPYPEQIDLQANGARVTGSTSGSVSPYVPDGSNRDCYSDIYSNGVPPGTMGPGGIDLNGYDDDGRLDVGVDSLSDWSGAFKFQVGLQFPLNVPQGAAITSSILEIETDRDATGDPTFRIFVADEDNVDAFSQGYPLLPDLYDWVNTSVYWDSGISGPGRYNTPDLSALIQKVVSRPGWQSGNYICIMIDYAFSNVQRSYIEIKGSSGFPQGQLAQLNVDFIAPDSEDVIPSFRYNKNIVIDHTKVVSDLQNFPVLVDIWDADLHFDAQPDGDDIAFLYNGQVIPHEMDAFDKQGNGTHAHLLAWVNVPYLSSVEDTTLVMVYGDGDLGSQENVDGVWDTDFSAIWHLSENPSQPQWSSSYADYLPHQPQISDVTSPRSDGTTYGSMTSSDLVSGFIGDAIDLEGGNDYIDFGTPSELSMSSGFTVEAWFYADFIDNDYLVIKSGESNFRGWDLSFDDDPSISPAGWVTFRWSSDGISLNNVGYERVDTGLWYQVVGVFSPSEYARFYLNGELVGEMTSGIPASVNDPNRPLRIGRRSDSGGTSYFDGLVDEVRISAVARSDAWIRTQYVNQRSPELFMTVGDESVNFRYRKDITVDHTKVASDLSGFPMLIDIYDTDLRTDVQSDGDDIMFTLNGRSLSHEIELFDQTFNSSHAHLVAWVKTDLSSSSDTVISMWYGNPSMGSQENPSEVWSNRYNGVWHLADTTGDARDSTYHGTDGSLLGGPTRGIDGQVGLAYDFDAIDDVVNFGDPIDGHLDFGDNDFTISIWINVDDTTGNWQLPLYKGGASASDQGYDFETTTDGQYFFFYCGDGTTNQDTDWGASVVFDNWMYFVGVVDRTSQTITLFMNGVEFGTANDISGIGSVSSDHDLEISRDQDGRRTNAMVDEVRVSSAARSAGWILTEYRNQNDPSSFFSVGVEQEAIPLNQAPTGFQFEKEITIDHTKVGSDLAGFPVLIDIYDTDLKTDVQADGDDIVFVRDGWLLNHEIELFEQDFNSSHAHLIAWVRTELSSISDTVISMYYGNPTATSQENPAGVWDTSFSAIWHLSEDPASTVYDSTLNDNDGVGRPIGSEPTLQLGKIYRCAEFYGEATNDRIEASHSTSLVLQSNMMIEAWVRTTNSDPTSDAIVAKWGDVGHRNYWLGKLNATTLAFYVDNTQRVTAPFNLVNDGGWHHVVGIANADSGELFLYVDGVERASDSYTGTTQTGTSVIQIANNPGSVGFIQEWDGRIDEVRVSRSYRSPGWILTEFNNQNDPGSFYSISDEIVPAAFGTYGFRKRISISTGSEPVSAGYSTSLTFDHGTLVSEGKSQADGDDIRIAHWSGSSWDEIDRVLDSDSSWNLANTKIWFQIQSGIPASSSDDYYYVYYGDAAAEFPPNNHTNVFQFYDGFEKGDLSGWDAWNEEAASDDISAVTSPPPPNTGTYSARCEIDNVAPPQAMVWENIADETSLFARTHLYLDPSFSISAGGHVTFMQYVDTSTGWQNQLAVTIRDDLTLYIWNAVAGEAYGYGTTSTLTTGTWYMLELHATFSATVGEVRLWLDGNLEVDESGKNTGAEGVDRYCAGFYWSSPQTEPNIIFIDDAYLRQYVNPEPSTSLGPELVLSADFNYKKDIVIDHTKVDADVTDFPLLIDIYDSDLKTKAQSDADDIIFKLGDLFLPHEIELYDPSFNSSHAHLVAWVKTDLSSTTDTSITMYYGNSQLTSQEDEEGTWNQNYKGVWHLNDDPTGTIYDSTSNNNDGTSLGGMNLGDLIPGQIDGSLDFDGSDDYITTNYEGITASNARTVSFWMKTSSLSDRDIISYGDYNNDRFIIRVDESSVPGTWVIRLEMKDAVTLREQRWSTHVSDGSWHHIAVVIPQDIDISQTLAYIDGQLDTVDTTYGTGIADSGSGGPYDLQMAFYLNKPGFFGTLDDVRISNTAHSAAWVLTEFRNQNDPETFYSVELEQNLGGQESVFDYKKDIVIDQSKVNSSLTDFPVLIDIYDADLKTDVQADGDDIVFVYDGTAVPYEIEFFDQSHNSTHAHLVAWVRVDLSSSADTVVSMYYGNPYLISQENPEDVWTNSYAGVWHLEETSGGSGAIIDSTANNNDGTDYNSPTFAQTGKISKTIAFDGTNQYIEIPNSATLEDITEGDYTYECWFYADQVPPGTAPSDNDKRYAAMIKKDPHGGTYYDNDMTFSFEHWLSGPTQTIAQTVATYDPQNWYHLVGVVSKTSGFTKIYVNGVLEDTDTWTPGSTAHDYITDTLKFAIASPGAAIYRWCLDGKVDEMRVSNTDRSADWIAAEYANQHDPSSFYSVGIEESLGQQESQYSYKKDIVVDHNKVAADLTDFPLLINIYDSDLKTDVQADGDDIIFEQDAVTIPHEIELFDQAFNSTHAHLIAWVKADLSASFDTVISMYYGNPTSGNQENSAGVWSNSFIATWHLKENVGGTDAIRDSTGNANHGTDSGAPTFGAAGMIGNAIGFDGSNDEVSLPGVVIGNRVAWTISAWIRMGADTTDQRTIYSEGDTGVSDYLFLYVDDAGSEVRFYSENAIGDWSQVIGSTNIEDNQWHLVTLVQRSKTDRELYVDGLSDGTSTHNAGTLTTDTASIGVLDYLWGPADWFMGTIDEGLISDTARSADWIAAEYANRYDPASFYSVGAEEQTAGAEEPGEPGGPSGPSPLDATGHQFTTSSTSGVSIGTTTSLSLSRDDYSLADDFTQGTSFSLMNGSIPIWTANVLVSPPPEIDSISFEVSYPEGEWFPVSVLNPSGEAMAFATNWTCFDGRLIVGANVVDEYGIWKIQFQDRNHVFDALMGPSGGPYSSSDEFATGDDIEFRFWSSGTFGSSVIVDLIDSTGSTWYSGPTSFQGKRFSLPYYSRKSLAISHGNVASNLIDFPVLIDITHRCSTRRQGHRLCDRRRNTFPRNRDIRPDIQLNTCSSDSVGESPIPLFLQ